MSAPKAKESLEHFESTHHHTSEPDDGGQAHLVRNAAVLVAVLAAFLAVATFLSETAMTHVITGETRAADAGARLQANEVKTTVAENDAALLRVIGTDRQAEDQAGEKAAKIEEELVAEYGPIDKDLEHEIVHEEHERDHAESQHKLFEFSSVALQIAIVLASISIIARSMWLLRGGGLLGVGAVGLLLAGLLA
jgi:hypothetical protein